MTLKKQDTLLSVLSAGTEDDLLMITRNGMSIRFPLGSVPVQDIRPAAAGDVDILCSVLVIDAVIDKQCGVIRDYLKNFRFVLQCIALMILNMNIKCKEVNYILLQQKME